MRTFGPLPVACGSLLFSFALATGCGSGGSNNDSGDSGDSGDGDGDGDSSNTDGGTGNDSGPRPDASPWVVCDGEEPPSGESCDTPPALKLTELPYDFDLPVFVTAARCDTTRLYVVEKDGLIKVIQNNTVSVFLDLTDVTETSGASDEGGLLGLAFHPDFGANGRLFVMYAGLDDEGSDTFIAEYQRQEEGQPTLTKVFLRSIEQGGDAHIGGTLEFGKDGALYASLGYNWQEEKAQDLSSVHGKLLRFDVDDLPDAVVGDNDAADYVFAYGLRNPYRFSFDRLTGDVWIGDVGLGTYEEVNVGPALQSGINYGWPDHEGPCGMGCGDSQAPLYAHGRGSDPLEAGVVIGGHVYRGEAIPCLWGFYVYGDYSESRAWALKWDGDSGIDGDIAVLTDDLFSGIDMSLVAIGEDASGELYVVDHGSDSRSGKVFRIDAE